MHPGSIGDDDDLLVERVGFAVERQQALAGVRAAQAEIAMDLARIENVQRACPVEGQEIGDVHERVDRTQADRRELPLQPIRAWPVFHAAHQAQRKGRREVPIRFSEIKLDTDRTGKSAGHRNDRRRRQSAEPRRGKIAGNSGDRHGIGAVRRQVDFDDRVVEPGPLRIGHADAGILRQFENAAVILGEFEFGAGTEHAVRFDAADDALGERDLLARNMRAGRGEDRLQAYPRIGRAADHLDRPVAAIVDETDAQAVGIGMRLCLDDRGDDETFERSRRIVDALDLEADLRQSRDDRVKLGVGLEMALEPGEGELHSVSGRGGVPCGFDSAQRASAASIQQIDGEFQPQARFKRCPVR